MPITPFIPAIIGAGTAIYSASAAKSAQEDALNAQNQATQAQLQAQKEARDQITQLQNPFIQSGYGALGQLANYYGLGGNPGGSSIASSAVSNPAVTGNIFAPGSGLSVGTAGGGASPQSGPRNVGAAQGGSPVATSVNPRTSGPDTASPYVGGVPNITPGTAGTQAGPDWNAYLQSNPDVAARAQQGVAEGLIGPGKQWQTPQEWAAFQYQNTGQAEGRPAPPMTEGTPATPGQSTLSPADQALSSAIGQAPVRPDQPTMPNFGASPDLNSFFTNFQADPGYQFNKNEQLRGLNASYGARGLLKSDAAIKAIMQRSSDLADQTYNNWFNRQNILFNDAQNQYANNKSQDFNIFNTNRANGNNLYSQDLGQFNTNRDYATNRYDTTANNLFRLVGLGTGAAASIGGANTNYANAAGSIYGQQGNNAANAALANGATNAQLGGALGGLASNIFNTFGNLPTPIPTQTIPSLNFAQGPATSASFVNPLPTYNYSGGF